MQPVIKTTKLRNDIVTYLLKDKTELENDAQFLTRQLVYIQLTKGITRSRIPVLVGTTQVGKTYWIRNDLAPALGLDCVVLTLQSDLPEDICGYPKHIEGDKLTMLKPEWLDTENPKLYFLDEFDKAGSEQTTPLLTFLCEGRIRNWQVPEGSVIVCAMNESDDMIDAMKARMAFLQFRHTPRTEAIDSIMKKLVKNNSNWQLKPKLPNQVMTPTSFEFLEEHMDVFGRMLEEPKLLTSFLYGIMPQDSVETAMVWFNELAQGGTIDYASLLQRPSKLSTYLKAQIREKGDAGVIHTLLSIQVEEAWSRESTYKLWHETLFTVQPTLPEWFILGDTGDNEKEWKEFVKKEQNQESKKLQQDTVPADREYEDTVAVLLGYRDALSAYSSSMLIKLENELHKTL